MDTFCRRARKFAWTEARLEPPRIERGSGFGLCLPLPRRVPVNGSLVGQTKAKNRRDWGQTNGLSREDRLLAARL